LEVELDEIPNIRCPHSCRKRSPDGLSFLPVIAQDVTEQVKKARQDPKARLFPLPGRRGLNPTGESTAETAPESPVEEAKETKSKPTSRKKK